MCHFYTEIQDHIELGYLSFYSLPPNHQLDMIRLYLLDYPQRLFSLVKEEGISELFGEMLTRSLAGTFGKVEDPWDDLINEQVIDSMYEEVSAYYDKEVKEHKEHQLFMRESVRVDCENRHYL